MRIIIAIRGWAFFILLACCRMDAIASEPVVITGSADGTEFAIDITPEVVANPPAWTLNVGAVRAGSNRDLTLAIRNRSGSTYNSKTSSRHVPVWNSALSGRN